MNFRAVVAPNSIASGFGTGLSTTTVANTSSPANGQPAALQTTLGNVSLVLHDNANFFYNPLLYLVSPGQINYVIPQTINLGASALTVRSGTTNINGIVLLSNVSPALITADGSGAGVPAGGVLRVTTSNVTSNDTIFQGGPTFSPKPIFGNSSDSVYLTLYGTGIRNRSLNPVVATIGGTRVPVLYAGAQSQYPGLDQLNVGPLPASLAGAGTVNLLLTVDGVPANTVQVAIQ